MRYIPMLMLIVVLGVSPLAAQTETPPYVTTFQQPDGNRVVGGSGTLPGARVIDVPLDGVPLWAVGQAAANGDLHFSLILEGGLTKTVLVHGETADVADGGDLPDGAITPPILMPNGGAPALPDMSLTTHPVPFGGGWLYVVRNSGEVALHMADGTEERLWLVAISDARPVVMDGLAALYTGSTDRRYVYGAVGDGFEGSSVTVLAARDGRLEQVGGVTLGGGEVFEGLSPLWADVDADGMPDLVTTVSSRAQGAQIRAYAQDGRLIAAGPAIGHGYRWRHQIAFGAFGPAGEHELAAVRTPHTGGVVEFYRLNGGALEIVAELPGYSSHRFGSRNLDMALAGDFNGDGRPELVVPDETFTRLAGIQRTENGADEVWSLPLDAELSTNLVAMSLTDGGLALAAGMDNGSLRLWLPDA